jgi:microcystin-dependent protein
MSNYYGANGYPIPTGAILPFVASASNFIPASYLYCNGGEYNPVLYPELYAVIGTQFNTGGETAGFFRVPDLVTNPYTGAGAFSPVVPPAVTFTENIPIATGNLPTMTLGDFTANIAFDPATTPSLYEHDNGNNIFGDNGSITTFTKANSSTRTTFAVAITGGNAPSYTPAVPATPAVATVTLGDVTPAGVLFIHIIKASQVGIAPQSLAPAVVPQFPAPQYLYTNMAWMSGFSTV